MFAAGHRAQPGDETAFVDKQFPVNGTGGNGITFDGTLRGITGRKELW